MRIWNVDGEVYGNQLLGDKRFSDVKAFDPIISESILYCDSSSNLGGDKDNTSADVRSKESRKIYQFFQPIVKKTKNENHNKENIRP